MTSADIDRLGASPEVDAAVLGAVGLTSDDDRLRKPSSRWADAMLSAERFGLFTTHGCVLGSEIGDDQRVFRWLVRKPYIECDLRPGVCEIAETGPLAICRAILKLEQANG